MKQPRVDLWSAASYAVSPRALRDEYGVSAVAGLRPRLLDDLLRSGNATNRSRDARQAAEALSTVEGRLSCQDQDGLSGEVLLPDPMLIDAVLADDDSGRQCAGIAAHNAWAAELQAGAPGRLVAVGQIPTTGLGDALAALEQAQSDGLRAVALSEPPAGTGTTPAEGDDFWRLAGDRTVVCFGPQFGGGRFADRLAPAVSAGRPSPHVATLTRLALTGVWDEVPELRVVIAGVDAGWIPYVLQAADTNYLRTRASRPDSLRRTDALPSEYVRRHAFATFHEDRTAVLGTHYFGQSHLMWSAAVPTPFSSWPNDEEQAARITFGLPFETRRRLLGENCRRVFRLDDSEPFTDTELSDFERPVLV